MSMIDEPERSQVQSRRLSSQRLSWHVLAERRIFKGAIDMVTIDELETRVSELSSDVEGEKAVTRQVYAQAVRNGDQIGALRSEVATGRVDIQNMTSRVDHMVTEVVQGTAMLRSHGLRLEALTRDVGLLRNDLTALRRGQEELHVRVDQVQADVIARVEQVQTGLIARLDRQDTRLEAMERNIAAILAAVAQGNPRPA